MRELRCVFLLGVLVLIGCGPTVEIPETAKVTGKVVKADGDPYSGGLVEFQPVSGDPNSATCIIGDDGAFELSTMIQKKKVVGAVPGNYRVVVMPMMGDQTQTTEPMEPIQVKGEYEVKLNEENDFTVTLP